MDAIDATRRREIVEEEACAATKVEKGRALPTFVEKLEHHAEACCEVRTIRPVGTLRRGARAC